MYDLSIVWICYEGGIETWSQEWIEKFHKMLAESANASPPRETCLSILDQFIKPIKEKRFTIVNECFRAQSNVS